MRLLLWVLFFVSAPVFAQNQTDTLKVFYLDGCQRCRQTADFLKDKKIPHKVYYYHVEKDQQVLGYYLNLIKFAKGQRLEFPVVVRGKEVFLNITNLDAFLDGLTGKKPEGGQP